MDEEKKYKIVVFDELGENELFSVADIGIDDGLQDKLLKGLEAAKVTRPLLHEQSQEWFHPAGSIKLIRSNDKIFFCQDGMNVFEANGPEIRLKVCSKGATQQNPKFIHKFMPSGPAVHIKFYQPASKHMNLITTTFGSWKKCFGAEHVNHLFWHRQMEDGTVKKSQIWLNGKSDKANDNEFAYLKDESGNLVAVPVETYMFISSEKLFLTQKKYVGTESDRLSNFDELFESFSYELSANGKKCVKCLVEEILASYAKWMAPESYIFAPIAFLVQGSGAGKSRITVELLQELPGFYCILRDSSGYPRANNLFHELKSALTDYQRAPARTLGLFAKMIVIYLRQWHAYTLDGLADNPDNESVELIAKRAFAQIGTLFYRNDLVDCSFLEDSEIDQLVRKGCHDAIAAAKFIKNILDDPSQAFPAVFDGDEVAFEAMKTVLATAPFVIVLDEADFFDGDGPFDFVKPFEQLRRALNLLERQTKLFVLPACKNSSKSFLYQPLDAAYHYRHDKRICESLEPIVFKSNSATFMHEYPIEDVVINYKVASNPMFFKYLATLSAPVWGSVSFSCDVRIAAQMMKNPLPANRPISPYERYDPDPDENCLVGIWMTRVGLIELPPDSDYAGILSKRHLGTVLETKPLRVTYPSDPMLAMASRSIINSIRRRELLFFVLRRMHCHLRLAAGELTKIVGTMTCLNAIDGSQKSVREKSYPIRGEHFVDELCSIMPKLEPLWKKKKYLLDYSAGNELRVVKVRDFLSSLLTKKVFEKIEANLPKEILDGLMNASHSVKVTRQDDTLKYHNLLFTPPKESKTIDDAMLQLGLTIQCMFSVSGCGFGFDALIPVVLEDDSFTYLAIQFGSVDSIASADRLVLSIDMHATTPFEQQEKAQKSEANEITIADTTFASNTVALVSSPWKDGERQFCIATRGVECFSDIFRSAEFVNTVKRLLQNDSPTKN